MAYPPDWCPLANHPCMCMCEKPCTASPPPSAAQKRRFIGNYFSEPWAQEAAQTMLDDFERFGYEDSTERAAAQQGTTP